VKKIKKIALVLFAISLQLVAQGEVDLKQNLLLHYKFDGNTEDSSVNGHDGAPMAIVYANDRNGNPYSAAFFNGLSSYVDFPNLALLKPDLPISVSMWVKFEDVGIKNSTVFTTDFTQNINTGVSSSLNSSTQTIAISFGDGGASGSSSRRSKYGTTLIEPDVWYFLVFVMKGTGDIDIYVHEYNSGALCVNDGGTYTGTGSNSISYGSVSGSIGRNDISNAADPYYFPGSVDEFMMWDKALSEADVLALCEFQKPLSVGENLTNSLKVFYLNRDHSIINISNEIKINKVLIYDSLGRMQITIEGNGINEINIENLKNGVYYLKTLDELGLDSSVKFIK
tara:strand:+ start:38491 stop:39507 length:1017 start_codon:yes stop_codon:yes gene_type:complete